MLRNGDRGRSKAKYVVKGNDDDGDYNDENKSNNDKKERNVDRRWLVQGKRRRYGKRVEDGGQ